jgi:hypothetical protein
MREIEDMTWARYPLKKGFFRNQDMYMYVKNLKFYKHNVPKGVLKPNGKKT